MATKWPLELPGRLQVGQGGLQDASWEALGALGNLLERLEFSCEARGALQRTGGRDFRNLGAVLG